MSRPLRPQACGAIYHVTSRGVRRMPIFVDAFDYSVWLDVLAEAAARYTLVIHAYCQMPNHYHLVVETPLGNIAAGIRYLNGKYCQYFNRKHKHLGHVSQCRYNAEMIERQAYLLELARYVVLNPVRAQLVSAAASWKWSSHQALLGYVPLPAWLDGDWILSQFGNGTRAACRGLHRIRRTGNRLARSLAPSPQRRQAQRTRRPIPGHRHAAHRRLLCPILQPG